MSKKKTFTPVECAQLVAKAEQARRAGDLATAEKTCKTLLATDDDHFAAVYTLGLVFGDKGQHRRAIEVLNKAFLLHPTHWPTHLALSLAYIQMRLFENARYWAESAERARPENPLNQQALGEICLGQRDYAQSCSHFEKAGHAGIVEAFEWAGRARAELGHDEEAIKWLEEAIRASGINLSIAQSYLQLPKSIRNPQFEESIRTFLIKSQNKDDRFQFLLSRLHEGEGDMDAAWQAAMQANNQVFQTTHASAARETEQQVKRVEWFAKNATSFKGRSISDPAVPISLFILGPSRSGKTTVEKLLAPHPRVKIGYESSALERTLRMTSQEAGLPSSTSFASLTKECVERFKTSYLAAIDASKVNHDVHTTTTPGYIWEAPFLPRHIPNVKFINVRRNRADLTWRILQKRYASGNFYSYNVAAIRRHLDIYDKAIMVLEEFYPQNVLSLHYEDIVSDPTNAQAQVYAFCGLENAAGILHPELGSDIDCAKELHERLVEEGL